MKNILLLLITPLLITQLSCRSSEEENAPEVVMTAFQKKYPDETDPDCHNDRNGNFEPNFKKVGSHYQADFSPDGSWIETERRIKKKDLPEAVGVRLKEDFDEYEVVEIEEVDHHSKGLFYDVELRKDGEKKDVELNRKGEVIN
jgi:hypothetical protein